MNAFNGISWLVTVTGLGRCFPRYTVYRSSLFHCTKFAIAAAFGALCYGFRPEGPFEYPACPEYKRHRPVFLFGGHGFEPSGCLFLPETKKISGFLLIFGSGRGKARRLKPMSSKKRNLSRFLFPIKTHCLPLFEACCELSGNQVLNQFRMFPGSRDGGIGVFFVPSDWAFTVKINIRDIKRIVASLPFELRHRVDGDVFWYGMAQPLF